MTAAGLFTRLWVLSKSAPRAPMTGTEMLYLWRSRRRMASSASYRQPSTKSALAALMRSAWAVASVEPRSRARFITGSTPFSFMSSVAGSQ